VCVEDVVGMWEGNATIGVGVEASPFGIEVEVGATPNEKTRVYEFTVYMAYRVYEYVRLNDFQLNQYSSFWLPRGLNGNGRPRHNPARLTHSQTDRQTDR